MLMSSTMKMGEPLKETEKLEGAFESYFRATTISQNSVEMRSFPTLRKDSVLNLRFYIDEVMFCTKKHTSLKSQEECQAVHLYSIFPLFKSDIIICNKCYVIPVKVKSYATPKTRSCNMKIEIIRVCRRFGE